MEKLKNALVLDWYMLPAKCSYFFTGGQDGSFKPYTVPFFVGIGLNKAEAGFVAGNNYFFLKEEDMLMSISSTPGYIFSKT